MSKVLGGVSPIHLSCLARCNPNTLNFQVFTLRLTCIPEHSSSATR